jgi:hypothetical protein
MVKALEVVAIAFLAGCNGVPTESTTTSTTPVGNGADAGPPTPDMGAASNMPQPNLPPPDMGAASDLGRPPRSGIFGPQIPATCAGQDGLQAGAQWPMRGHDNARSNRTSAIIPTTLSLRASAPVAAHTSGPELGDIAVAADGTVYVTDVKGVHAFDAALTPKWTFASDGHWPHTPTIRRDGSIVVAASSTDSTAGKLFALSPDGALRWSSDVSDGTPQPYGTNAFGVSIGCDQSIYTAAVGTRDPASPRMLAFTSGGALAWVHGEGYWTPRLGPLGTVYGGGPTVLNPDGSPFYITGGTDTCSYVSHIAPDGTLFMGAMACTVDGYPKWNVTIWTDSSSEDAAVTADGGLLLPGTRAMALDASGAVRWQTGDLPMPPSCGPGRHSNTLLDGRGTMFFAVGQAGYHCGTEGTSTAPPTSTLFALDSTNGAILTSIDMVTLAGGEQIELAAGAGRLYALCYDQLVELAE